jgi:hypothetical protein
MILQYPPMLLIIDKDKMIEVDVKLQIKLNKIHGHILCKILDLYNNIKYYS